MYILTLFYISLYGTIEVGTIMYELLFVEQNGGRKYKTQVWVQFGPTRSDY